MFIITASISRSTEAHLNCFRIDIWLGFIVSFGPIHKVNTMSQHGIAYKSKACPRQQVPHTHIRRERERETKENALTLKWSIRYSLSSWHFSLKKELFTQHSKFTNCWHGYDMRSFNRIFRIYIFFLFAAVTLYIESCHPYLLCFNFAAPLRTSAGASRPAVVQHHHHEQQKQQ